MNHKREKSVELRDQNDSSAQQSLLTEHQQTRPEQKVNEFDMDLYEMFLEANIPLKKPVYGKNMYPFYTKIAPKCFVKKQKTNIFGCSSTQRPMLNSD